MTLLAQPSNGPLFLPEGTSSTSSSTGLKSADHGLEAGVEQDGDDGDCPSPNRVRGRGSVNSVVKDSPGLFNAGSIKEATTFKETKAHHQCRTSATQVVHNGCFVLLWTSFSVWFSIFFATSYAEWTDHSFGPGFGVYDQSERARWHYTHGKTFFDNTIWTWGSDYLLTVITWYCGIRLITKSAEDSWRIKWIWPSSGGSGDTLVNYADRYPSVRLLLASTVFLNGMATLSGALAHQHFTPEDLVDGPPLVFRFLWTICLSSVAFSGWTSAVIGYEVAVVSFANRRPLLAKMFGAFSPGCWLWYTLIGASAAAYGEYSCSRPAADIFLVGVTVSMPQLYLILVTIAVAIDNTRTSVTHSTRTIEDPTSVESNNGSTPRTLSSIESLGVPTSRTELPGGPERLNCQWRHTTPQLEEQLHGEDSASQQGEDGASHGEDSASQEGEDGASSMIAQQRASSSIIAQQCCCASSSRRRMHLQHSSARMQQHGLSNLCFFIVFYLFMFPYMTIYPCMLAAELQLGTCNVVLHCALCVAWTGQYYIT
ncbi:unnamed protein product [Amoebophrya sp. A25]|nr:unnamed protein product [Amoebophrya sp. A25]|eukprot:GSA25T00027211001.1